MDWSNEPYVRMYTRETDDDLVLSWDAHSVWRAMLLKFDRSGTIETKRGARGLAALLRAPLEVVERALPELLTDGRLVEIDTGFLAPNFMAAQEANKSDRLRQKESRDRRRSQSLQSVTNRDATVTKRDRSSRDIDHAEQNVTLTSADPDPLQCSAGPRPPARAEHSTPPPPKPQKEISTTAAGSSPPPDQDLVEPLTRTATHVEAVGSAFRALWAELNRLRAEVAAEYGLADVWPIGEQNKHAFALQRRLRAAGEPETVAAEARHVLAVLAAEARVTRSVQWLSDLAFSDGVWARAMRTTPADARRDAKKAQGRDRDEDAPKLISLRGYLPKGEDEMPPLGPFGPAPVKASGS